MHMFIYNHIFRACPYGSGCPLQVLVSLRSTVGFSLLSLTQNFYMNEKGE